MLVSWTVSDFKPICGTLSLPLSPLTVLVGANSSGKSSLIQSILLIKQTLQYATADRSIALNGPILKLGDFGDVKNVFAEGNTFKIGWHYDRNFFQREITEAAGVEFEADLPFRRREIADISFELSFGVDKSAADAQLASLQPILQHCRMSGNLIEENDTTHFFVEVQNVDESLPGTVLDSKLGNAGFRSICEIDDESSTVATERYPDGEIVGAIIRWFYPYYLAVKYDPARRTAARIADLICSLRFSPTRRQEFDKVATPPDLTRILDDWINKNAELLEFTPMLPFEISNRATLGDIFDWLEHLYRSYRHRPQKGSFPSLQELQPQIENAIFQSLPSSEEMALETAPGLSDAATRTRQYFAQYVHYLGPLRDEPKPLYPLEVLGSPTDVGFRGEHTAAVLHLNKYRAVSYLPAENLRTFKVGEPIDTTLAKTSLKRAVADWLSYLGVARDIDSDDLGKIGHQLRVSTGGIERFLDLTNVGVGVSQVVPIVVMSILARPGSLLIFEQPELHLHPKVQTRLADFFLSLALSGKQCILETHSEYLLHRLRRRIAESPEDQLAKINRLYFVEQSNGKTRCRPVSISKYGAIEDWPMDFFDQAQEESDRILSAAGGKRSRERTKTK